MSSPRLLLGPLLRYVDSRRATLWVETDRACRVEILGQAENTWSVHGHHYALVVVEGLQPGQVYPYQVHLDGVRAWPEDDPAMPPSVVRTTSPGRATRLTFGSCRRAAPLDAANTARYGADALVGLARRTAEAPHAQWPDTLFLAGDQVYADEPSDALRRRLSGRHEDPEVAEEIGTFEEYTWLYHETWSEPQVRWLLSSVPTLMLLDDHDLRDDWNTSLTWRQWITAQPWWRDRVVGAFASYWVYQHLGNLSPDALAADPLYAMVRTEPDDVTRDGLLDEYAWRADADPASARWSVVRDLATEGGAVRLILLDTRCSRALDPGRRAIVDDVEWAWFLDQVAQANPVDHLLIGSTLPVLLAPGIHHLEGWDEAVAAGAWGPRAARIAERLRQALDLEHWASFRASLHRLCGVLADLGRREHPPASVLLLSGDVHSSSIASAALDGVRAGRTAIFQLTMSPFRNPLGRTLRVVVRALSSRPLGAVAHWFARRAGVVDVPIRWKVEQGTWFDNGLMTIVIEGRSAQVEVDHAFAVDGDHVLRRTHTTPLTR